MIFENLWRAFSNLEILCFGKTQTGLFYASADSEFPIRDDAWRRLRKIFFQATGYEKRQKNPKPDLHYDESTVNQHIDFDAKNGRIEEGNSNLRVDSNNPDSEQRTSFSEEKNGMPHAGFYAQEHLIEMKTK
jgi:hypothetical protein